MLTGKRVEDRMVRYYVCDRCGEILQEEPATLDGAEHLCPRCFGDWFSRTEPIPYKPLEPHAPLKRIYDSAEAR
jgi:hypothetical protein